MKQVISMLLCMCLVLPLFGCNQAVKIEKPVTYYYRRAELTHGVNDGVIAGEQRESLGHEGDIGYLLAQYISGPHSAAFDQTFPNNLFIVSLRNSNNIISIVFSYHLAELSGIDLTIACACITKTVIEMTGVEAVQISSAGELLDDYQFITMDKDSLLLLDSSGNGN